MTMLRMATPKFAAQTSGPAMCFHTPDSCLWHESAP